MKILITGATGFVGKALSEKLVQNGNEVIVFTRKKDQAYRIPAPVTAIEWNFSDPLPEQDLDKIQSLDAVVHLAGEPILGGRWTSKFKARQYQSRVENTQNLTSLIKTHCKTLPKVFLNASAIGFYGDRGNENLDETSATGKGYLSELCQEWENVLFSSEMKGTRKLALRFGIVLGQGGGALDQMLAPFSAGLGAVLGDGSQWMSWIHLEDLLAIIVECLQNEAFEGPINCTSPHPVTNREFTKHLVNALKTVQLISIPKIAVKLGLGEASSAVLSSARVFPGKLLNKNFSYQYPTLDVALNQILGGNLSQGYFEFATKCWIPKPVHEVFEFFSKASNLERIMPPSQKLHLLSKAPNQIQTGTIMEYQFKIHGIRRKWKSKIDTWNPPHEFKDIQLKGPFNEWKHTHHFSPLRGGTLMEDRVLYRPPLGVIGRLSEKMIAKGIVSIFGYRNRKIVDLLSKGRTEVPA